MKTAPGRSPAELREEVYRRRGQVYELARDKWPELLRRSGVHDDYLRLKKSGPCPLCPAGKGGHDRFSFTDRNGDGDYICRRCGAGKGVTFLMKLRNVSWVEAVDHVLEMLGDPSVNRLSEEIVAARVATRKNTSSPEQVAAFRAKCQRIWDEARQVKAGDPVHQYLVRRVPGLSFFPEAIRFHPGLDYFYAPDDPNQPRYVNLGRFPAMVCKVTDSEGQLCNIHRTFLTKEGNKAQLIDGDGVLICDKRGNPLPVRKEMPSSPPCVSPCIRLADGEHAHLGVAEGVETALASWVFSSIPTWSLRSTSGMRGFVIPSWVTKLSIFADNDLPDAMGKRAGFDAAHALAARDDVVARVRQGSLKVLVRAPSKPGTDIADLLLGIHQRQSQRQPLAA